MGNNKINTDIYNKQTSTFKNKASVDIMQYCKGMEIIDSNLFEQVYNAYLAYDYNKFTQTDVETALNHQERTPQDFAALLSPNALPLLEKIAQAAQAERKRFYGNSVNFFTPLYIANYCENYCIYCGFNSHNKIKRACLSYEQIAAEMQAIARTGQQEILILTGESRKMSNLQYIGKACQLAKQYFKVIGVEIYPLNSDEYAYLHKCGADYVTVFQETYNKKRYEQLHLAGNKRVFPYRFYAQERALIGGMRGVGFGALLGLDDFRLDAFAVGMHAHLLQRKYPYAEISLSCPRIRPIINNSGINSNYLNERHLLQIVCAYRLFLPFASITISSRECARIRNHLMLIAANKISAGVSTGIGTHTAKENLGDKQFEIADNRSLSEIYTAMLNLGLQPVMSDYVYV